MTDLDKIVLLLSESFQVLVTDGHIPQARVDERARNQAVVVQMIIEDATKDLAHRLALVETYREAEDIASDLSEDLRTLQTERADANAKAYASAKEDLDRLTGTLRNEQRKRRKLDEVNANLTAQLKRDERLRWGGRPVFEVIHELEAKVKETSRHLDESNLLRQNLEDELTAIVAKFEPRPF